jgi:hypothetical protein
VGNVDLTDRATGTSGADLHLKGPSPVSIVHPDGLQAGRVDGTERAQVTVLQPEEKASDQQDRAVTQPGVGTEIPPGSTGGNPRAQNQVGLSGSERRKEIFQGSEVLGVVRIQEDHT